LKAPTVSALNVLFSVTYKPRFLRLEPWAYFLVTFLV